MIARHARLHIKFLSSLWKSNCGVYFQNRWTFAVCFFGYRSIIILWENVQCMRKRLFRNAEGFWNSWNWDSQTEMRLNISLRMVGQWNGHPEVTARIQQEQYESGRALGMNRESTTETSTMLSYIVDPDLALQHLSNYQINYTRMRTSNCSALPVIGLCVVVDVVVGLRIAALQAQW